MKKLKQFVLATGVVFAIGVSMLSVSATNLTTNPPCASGLSEVSESATQSAATTEDAAVTETADLTENTEAGNIEDTAVTEAADLTENTGVAVTESADLTENTDTDSTADPADTADSVVTVVPDTTEDTTVNEAAEHVTVDAEIVIKDELTPLGDLPGQTADEAAVTVRQVLVYADKEYVETEVFPELAVGDFIDTASYIRDDERVVYTSGAEVVEVTGSLTVSLYYEMR